eukprot:TRINITY_DN4686_c0_g1_i2.p1 TRINITY_DN4686_c0_g1~~TRINITY_DN4686_c0_g1_i2.p1  ORF type:complete len:350 (-),score=65.40 TRINITY_DN4686_c0_g1_i2:69-1019(-)
MKLVLSNMEHLSEGDVNADDQLSTAPPSLSGDMAIVLQGAEDLESECVPQHRTNAVSARWADMEDSDEEVDARCQEYLLLKNASSELTDRLSSQQASRTCDYDTTPSITSAHCCLVGRSKDASADAARKLEEVGEASEQKRLLSQTDRGVVSGGMKGLGKGLTKGAGKGSCKGSAKGSGAKGGRKSEKGKSGGKGSKCQCQFTIGIEEEKGFRVCNRLLGPKGQHMKAIAEATGARLRLRGRGSKFLEAPDWVESSDPLVLCLSAPDATTYAEANRLVQELLEDVYQQFRRFNVAKGRTSPQLFVDMHEGPREGSL